MLQGKHAIYFLLVILRILSQSSKDILRCYWLRSRRLTRCPLELNTMSQPFAKPHLPMPIVQCPSPDPLLHPCSPSLPIPTSSTSSYGHCHLHGTKHNHCLLPVSQVHHSVLCTHSYFLFFTSHIAIKVLFLNRESDHVGDGHVDDV